MEYKVNFHISVDNDEVKEMYKAAIANHNAALVNYDFGDSGFDLYCLKDKTVKFGETCKIDTSVVAAAFKRFNGGKWIPTGYFLYPRSSISKTPLRLANSVGIIDSGYRGNLIAKLDNTGYSAKGMCNDEDFQIKEKSKYLQICMPDLSPFHIDYIEDIVLIGETRRGSGGFGSTD